MFGLMGKVVEFDLFSILFYLFFIYFIFYQANGENTELA